MRTVKEASIRKNEILDIAQELFITKGYDQTSTQDLLKAAGIARGTLYYHFKSKEDILNAMIERMSKDLLEKARVIVEDKDIPALQRLTRSLLAMQVSHPEQKSILDEIHKPQNALLHVKMQQFMVEGMTPLLSSLIREAMAEGICQSDYPEEVVEMTVLYTNSVFDDVLELDEATRRRKILAFIDNLERMLKMKQGSLMEVILPLFMTSSNINSSNTPESDESSGSAGSANLWHANHPAGKKRQQPLKYSDSN